MHSSVKKASHFECEEEKSVFLPPSLHPLRDGFYLPRAVLTVHIEGDHHGRNVDCEPGSGMQNV
jgi:hypothetical protein